jgi:hypothetical protein
MKKVLVWLMGAMLIASLSLVVSCQKQEEPAQTGETTSSYSEKAMSTTEKAGEQLEKATEAGEKAMGEAAESGEKAMKETTEKAAGYGQ